MEHAQRVAIAGLLEATSLAKSVGAAEFGYVLGLYLALAVPTIWVNESVFAQQELLAVVFVALGIG